jgi:trk system potassium uptake protein TrkA
MKKQCIIIGLGRFGMTLAKQLSQSNMEVLAIDKEMHLVEKASNFVTKAISINVYDEEAFSEIPLDQFDLGVVAIGDDITTNIISCLALKDGNVKYVIAKAKDATHRKLLEKLDVDEIILPEEDMAKMLAKKLTEVKD